MSSSQLIGNIIINPTRIEIERIYDSLMYYNLTEHSTNISNIELVRYRFFFLHCFFFFFVCHPLYFEDGFGLTTDQMTVSVSLNYFRLEGLECLLQSIHSTILLVCKWGIRTNAYNMEIRYLISFTIWWWFCRNFKHFGWMNAIVEYIQDSWLRWEWSLWIPCMPYLARASSINKSTIKWRGEDAWKWSCVESI